MRKYILTIVATLFSAAVSAASIGQWNTYLAYKSITDIEPSGEKVFVLASTNLYSYNPNDQSIGHRHLFYCMVQGCKETGHNIQQPEHRPHAERRYGREQQQFLHKVDD